jgi:protein O-GlcNAc transferase
VTLSPTYLPRAPLLQTVCPASSRHCYSESIAYLPHSYFVNDYRQAHPEVLEEANLPSRAEIGLPQDKVVFSCANQVGG